METEGVAEGVLYVFQLIIVRNKWGVLNFVYKSNKEETYRNVKPARCGFFA